MVALALSQHASIRLSEVGFLLFLIAGVWLVAAEVLDAKWTRFRMTVSGALIAAGSILEIVALHWGHLGK